MRKEKLILIGLLFSAILVAFSVTLVFIPLLLKLFIN